VSLSKGLTVVLLDRHSLWQDAVEAVLARVGLSVAGKATQPEEALALVEEHQPGVVVAEIDTDGAEMDGLSFLRRARERSSGRLKIVVLSALDDPRQVDAAFAAGANSYVLKTARREDLSVAVRQLFSHSVYFASDRTETPQVPASPQHDSANLTPRELEILRLVAEGHTNAQLAKMLWVSDQTVKFHLSNIYRKLDVGNRTEASRWAQVHGLLSASKVTAA
jgi:DNA-binding NarL/FixJ family response regulator